MSSLLDIIETVTVDEDGSMWIFCQPITESAPKDIPEIEDIASKYWTAKILSQKGRSTNALTEWFSIPYRNIQTSLETHIEGPCVIDYKSLNQESKEDLLNNTNPVFSLKPNENKETFRWLDK